MAEVGEIAEAAASAVAATPFSGSADGARAAPLVTSEVAVACADAAAIDA